MAGVMCDTIYCSRCGRSRCAGACSALQEFETVTTLDSLESPVGRLVYHLKRRGHDGDLCRFHAEVLGPAMSTVAKLCRLHGVTQIVFAPISLSSLATPPFHPCLLLHESLRKALVKSLKPRFRKVGIHSGVGGAVMHHHVWSCALLGKVAPSQSLARRSAAQIENRWLGDVIRPSSTASYWRGQMEWRQPIVLQTTASATHRPELGDGLLVIDDVLSSGRTVSRTAALCDRYHRSTWHCFALVRTLRQA